MESEAQNFSGTYPLAGERVGPAWRAMWAEMSRTRWINGNELSERVAERTDLNPTTTRNLLRAAVKAGILRVKQEKRPGMIRRQAFYRAS